MRLPILNSQLQDPSANLFNCQILNCFNSSDPANAFVNIIAPIRDPGDTVSYYAATASTPAQLFCASPLTGLFVFIDGYRSPMSLPLLLGRWGLSFVGNGPKIPGAALIPANAIYANQPIPYGHAFSQLTIVGYSLGGMIAPALGFLNLGSYSSGRQAIFTYGGPRCASSGSTNLFAMLDFFRFRMVGDPVPSIPPWASEAPGAVALAVAAFGPHFGQYVQPNNCFIVQPNGTITVGTSGGIPVLTGDLRIADWLAGGNALGSANHALSAYMDAFQAGVVNPVEVGNAPPPPDVPEPRPPEGRAQRGDMERGLRQISVQTAAAPMTALQNMQAAIVPAADVRFHRSMLRGQHVITYQGQIVGVCRTKREAQFFVKSANAAAGLK